MLNDILAQLRREAGLTQTQLAGELKNRLGRGSGNASTISMIESGEVQPRLDMVEALADYFCVPVDYLLGRTDNRKPYPSGRSVTFAIVDEHQEAIVKEYVEFIVSLPPDVARVMLVGYKEVYQAVRYATEQDHP